MGAVEAVAEIAEAGDDVFFGVQGFVEDSQDDRYIGVGSGDGFDAFGGAEDADEANIGRAVVFHELQGVGGGASRGQHWINHDRAGVGDGWEFAVVAAGFGGFVVALEADVADGGVRENILERLEHSETGAQDGNDHERPRQHATRVRRERGFDVFLHRLEVARGLEGEHEGELVAKVSEKDGLRGAVAQVREDVVGERVLEQAKRHGEIL